ncbi:MAG: hypothetical protein OEY24_08675 [Candidatus Bathyarchaeota archaeon]|nr:hypothetical protein [Candidatus Bathyarchaeota archaeon]MDH5495756.1 hypothetical protein [Candidatus Bathyarchaeota archaeon]
MKKPKEKQTVDLLDLPQKERVRLCKEIHDILQQRVIEEKDSQQKTETETQEHYRNKRFLAKTTESYLTKIKNRQICNRLV